MSPLLTAEEWDRRLAEAARPGLAPLLQSWAWGEVQARSGWRVERLELPSGALASVQLRGRAPLERAYVPRGPVPAGEAALTDLARWSAERGLARLRVEPDAGAELVPVLRGLGFRPSPQVQPKYTMIVKLGDEDETLASFNRGTRYNIRLAAKRGVTVEEGTDGAEMARQAAASASRQGIRLPAAAYYGLLLDLLPWCRTYVARVDGEAVAAMVVIHHDGRGYYMFSGANGRHRELKPVYAAKWAAIRAAIRDRCRDYDLWGVPPGPDRTHPWYGLWEFKSGFNGELVEYAGCWDLVLGEVRHGLTEASEKARRSLGRLLRRGA
ncbi:MAG TPA: peptidoglycan bridge formation glycyltransferase FemA/FemB family protein [Candidatus Dormibacteraeota bacterium]|nr:peptidoglycan bridge formation glycyltransferase FemA/FemB family protein [Candidatus Dormibacteraeota bacterium]